MYSLNRPVVRNISLLTFACLAAFALLWWSASVRAATNIVVNTTNDNAANDGLCTLREAIMAANSDAASGAAVGECAAGSGADTITFSVTGTITLTSGLPTNNTPMTISGPGAAQLTVSGNNARRVFFVDVASPNVVAFTGLTIANGNANSSDGGGIYNNSTGTVSVANSTLSGNIAGGQYGGGIFNNSTGTVNVTNSTLSGNSAPNGFGGGITNGTGTVNVTNSTLSGNSAGNGGGIFIQGTGTVNVTNSTLSGNSTSFNGFGGGISSFSGTANLGNSIIAKNTATNGPDLAGTFTTQGYNLVGNKGTNATITATTGDQFGTTAAPLDPLLGPLQDNGGPTFTRALLPGSPAIDKGKDLSLTGKDQRGFPRPFDDPAIAPATGGDNSDIGAFEVQLVVNSTADTNDNSCDTLGTGTGNKDCTLREAINAANTNPGADTISFALPNPSTITLTSVLPAITTAMTISGPGAAQLTVSGNNAVRVFLVNTASPNVVAFTGLTIANGNASSGGGGGLFINGGATVTITDSIISNNITTNASGGGGILNFGALTIIRSTISSNSAMNARGGGVRSLGTLTISDSLINGNTANGASAVASEDSTAILTNTTISGNGLTGAGEAILNVSINQAANLTLTNCTVTGNNGSGIYTSRNPTGSSTTTTLKNSIIANNPNPQLDRGAPDTTYISQGYNLTSDNGSGFLTATGDQINTNPLLGPLQDNGGPTFTRALLPGSPAIDKGKNLAVDANSNPILTDQRGTGFPRPRDFASIPNAAGGDGSDIGAFELQTEPLTISGTITFAGNPLASVTVTASGALTATTQTDASGNYTLPNLPNGAYTVTPTKTGFTFTPANRPVTLSTTNVTAQNFTATSTLINAQPANGPVLISEYRLQGPTPTTSPTPGNTNGELDEFIELYNNSNASVNVSGYQLAASTGNTITLPANTTLPARGHYLVANADGYTLANYGGPNAAAPDQTYTGFDLPLNAGLVLLNTTNGIVDAVGQTTSTAPYKEGTGLTPISGSGAYSFVRRLTTGMPQDTGDNRADFAFITTDAGQFGRTTTPGPDGPATLGAPGPENLASPVQRNDKIKTQLIDPGCTGNAAAPTQACPRYRSLAPVTNGSQGTLSIRRRFVNNTGAAVTRLRFRVADITTTPAPAGTADLRAITSPDQTAICQGTGNGCSSVGMTITINGTTLEEPPAQTLGGGINSTLSAGTITLGAPLGVGAGMNLQFLLGVQQGGSYRFFINVESLPGTSPLAPDPLKPATKGALSSKQQ